jgi:hypothetical protein
MTSVPVTPSAQDTTATMLRLRWLGVGTVFALLAQVLVGVADALWLNVPQTGSAWQQSTPQFLLTLHLVVGTVVLALVVWLAVLAVRAHDRVWTSASLVGIIGVVLGFAGGILFMGTNGQGGWSSMLMAIGCVGAIAGYAVALARRG